MKNLICILLMLISTQVFTQDRARKIRYSGFLIMPGKVLENIGPKDIPSYVTKTSKGLRISQKFKFVISGSHSLVVPANLASSEHDNDYQTFFAIVSKTRKADGSMFVTYCSCGSNTTTSSGDGCTYGTDGEGQPQCYGGCYGPENEGKTCSFTQVHYPPIGSGASPRSREVTF